MPLPLQNLYFNILMFPVETYKGIFLPSPRSQNKTETNSYTRYPVPSLTCPFPVPPRHKNAYDVIQKARLSGINLKWLRIAKNTLGPWRNGTQASPSLFCCACWRI